MATTNSCQRLKDILQGKTINPRRPKSDSSNIGNLEHKLPALTTTVQQLPTEIFPNKNSTKAKVLRLRNILHKGDEVSDLIQKPATQVTSPPVASREPQPSPDAQPQTDPLLSRPNTPDVHVTNCEPEENKPIRSPTVDRLKRILAKKGTPRVCKSHDVEATTEKVCNENVASGDSSSGTMGNCETLDVGSAAEVVVSEKVDPTSCVEGATRSDKRKRASKLRVTFSETTSIIPTSGSSTPEPQDVPSQRQQRKIAKRHLPQSTRTDVVVVGVRSNFIYVQETSMLRELVNTMQALQSAIPDEPQVPGVPEPHTYVAALRPEDGTWYRARVERERGAAVEVFYVDYGNKGTVGTENLRSLPAPFLDVPAFAMSVRPQGVDEVDAGIIAYLRGQVFVAEVVECVEKQRVVRLYEKESGQCINELLKDLIEILKENLE
ncbi:uncharacterized protein LOC135397141 [Ornithodoros turicata]|uniref:uncharacterized protein LOC135397141 n=1 Tax=Ornithodoros turicata TaxID=34597 RepID=UPI0031394209